MNELQGPQRRYLAREAHSLKPLVYVGKAGVTDEVVRALDEALGHHELVKVKFNGHKDEKQPLSRELAGRTSSALVSVIGNIAVIYRRNEDPDLRRYVLP